MHPLIEITQDSLLQNKALGLPLWESEKSRQSESVLFVRGKQNSVAKATLLFKPERLLRIVAANGSSLFDAKSDFLIEGNCLISKRPDLGILIEALYSGDPSEWGRTRNGSGHLLYAENHYFHDRQIMVDYETEQSWAGPVPHPQAHLLPRLHALITSRQSCKIAVLGDSISCGCNSSGNDRVAPFQPYYAPLLARQLCLRSESRVQIYNFSKGCMDSGWGVSQAEEVGKVSPDLVLIAFGMNDASAGMEVGIFRNNIRKILDGIKSICPDAEFVLISGMSANPEWISSHASRRHEMHEALAGLSGAGIAFGDVKTTWDYIVERKGFWSLTGNGVNHPNDYGHQLYAECLLRQIMAR